MVVQSTMATWTCIRESALQSRRARLLFPQPAPPLPAGPHTRRAPEERAGREKKAEKYSIPSVSSLSRALQGGEGRGGDGRGRRESQNQWQELWLRYWLRGKHFAAREYASQELHTHSSILHVHVYMYTTCTCTCMYMHECMACTHVCTDICTYVYVHVCMRTCTCSKQFWNLRHLRVQDCLEIV